MGTKEMNNSKSSREKLDSYEATMVWDKAAQFRAITYAKLLRKMIDAFGEDVLDIAENIRRESGRYCGELTMDIVENEIKYERDPTLLIGVMEEFWQSLSADWSRTCICDYNTVPEELSHELKCVRCTYAEAFRGIKEEKIGITWCCWDMGYTPTFHPLFCQYMPKHMLKGDGICYQIRKLAKDFEEQKWLNSTENTGWRSWK